MAHRPGRPMKYDTLIQMLDDDELYSPASIAYFAEEQGLLKSRPDDTEAQKKEMLQIRTAMARFAKNRGFPEEGNGMLKFKGHAPVIAWKGCCWKTALLGKEYLSTDYLSDLIAIR